jgi:hypothetical protein
MERQDEKSAGKAVVNFAEHDSRGLPHVINVSSQGKRGTLYARFVIETIESAAGVNDSVFTLDPAGVATIMDSDTNTFLKTKGWSRPVSVSELIGLCEAKQKSRGGGGGVTR